MNWLAKKQPRFLRRRDGRGDQLFCAARPEQETEADVCGFAGVWVCEDFEVDSAGWAEFIDPYLAIRSTLKLCVCLVDSNVPAQQSDAQLFDWLRGAEREFVVVATKIDRLSGNERTRNLLALKKGLGLDEVLPVSAKTGYGIRELWRELRRTVDSEQ